MFPSVSLDRTLEQFWFFEFPKRLFIAIDDLKKIFFMYFPSHIVQISGGEQFLWVTSSSLCRKLKLLAAASGPRRSRVGYAWCVRVLVTSRRKKLPRISDLCAVARKTLIWFYVTVDAGTVYGH